MRQEEILEFHGLIGKAAAVFDALVVDGQRMVVEIKQGDLSTCISCPATAIPSNFLFSDFFRRLPAKAKIRG